MYMLLHRMAAMVRMLSFSNVSCFSCDILNSQNVGFATADDMFKTLMNAQTDTTKTIVTITLRCIKIAELYTHYSNR